MTSLPKPEIDSDELIHDNLVRIYNQKYPLLDPLMCSVLLKCPPELLQQLKDNPEMWITPSPTTTLISDAVSVSFPEPSAELSDPEPSLEIEEPTSVIT